MEYDLIVAGGGISGCAAAISAARCGLDVLLIERYGFLGGTLTANGTGPMMTFHAGDRQVVRGITGELIDRLQAKGSSPGHIFDTTGYTFTVTPFDAEAMKRELETMVLEAGGELLFHGFLCGVERRENRIESVTVCGKNGVKVLKAKVFIDATGDADLLYRAGVPTVQGRNFHTYVAHGANLQSCKQVVDTENIAKLYVSYAGGHASLYGDHHPENMAYYTGTSSEDVNTYFVRNQIECLHKIEGDIRTSRDITMLPGMAQFRTTRRIDGDYTLKNSDMFRHFDDSIAAVNDFDRRDFLYEVPYHTMIKSGYPNLITAGRTVAGEEYAWDILRVIPPAILTGQAAGNAAALAIDEGCGIDTVPVTKLQEILASQNVMIHFDDALINWDADPGRVDDNGHF